MRHSPRLGVVLCLCAALSAPAFAASPQETSARLLDVGWTTEGHATKFVVALERDVQHQVWMQGRRIVVDLWPARLRAGPAATWAGFGPLGRVRLVQPLPAMARVTIDLRRPVRYRVYQKPGKLALVLVPPWMATVPVPPSVGYARLRAPTRRGPTTVHVLTVDVGDPTLDVRPALAGGRVRGTEPTSAIAHRTDAVAAVNGGFFAGMFPLGLVVLDGRPVAAPLERRSVLAVTKTGAVIRDFALTGIVRPLAGEPRRIGTLNRPPAQGTIGVYTDAYGPWLPPQRGRFHVVISDDTVTGHAAGGSMIPPGGMVLSVPAPQADWVRRVLGPGQRAEIGWALSPDLPLRWALGGGPRLVKAGRPFVPYDWEAFRPGVYAARAPRTAVGVTWYGKLLFVTVDGRSRRNPGMTLRELAALMVRLGARDAMNLDGGGSATMVVGGRVVNAPSDGGERGVASAIVIVRRDALEAQSR